MLYKKLPVGIEFFDDLHDNDFYYVDKTGLIRDLLNNWSKVNLFTRPRRFGKTLTMSMLKCFFEIGADPKLFDGLEIAKEKELCEKHMGQYPVIFVTLKGVEGLNFEEAYEALRGILQREVSRFHFTLSSERISEENKSFLNRMVTEKDTRNDVTTSFQRLSSLLEQHYEKKVILLIDEYDVPLAKAFQNGYYREMVSLMRGLLGNALKTNDSLQFAVLTGCLRVSKESIFTGLNNLEVNSIVDTKYGEHFGFTEAEVVRLMRDYHLEDHMPQMREWYDGYHFGDADIYCPWDVIRYAKKLLADPQAEPEAFWINTSGNDLVKRFIDIADKTTQNEIERLVAGEAIEKKVRLDLTYDELDSNIENLWSVLFTTGYLTPEQRIGRDVYRLVIPNEEIRTVFVDQIQEWFRERIAADKTPMHEFCQAFADGRPVDIEKRLNGILSRMISVLDTKAPDHRKESFYHGLLLGLLRSESDWLILSNAESGDGFCDILVEPEDPDLGIVIEVKYARTAAELEKACGEALMQIRDKRYSEHFSNEGRTEIRTYGIAFSRKRCRVMRGE